MPDFMNFTGLLAIGTAVAMPLAYGLSTLLGMTHKEFRPILHRNLPDGTTEPVVHDQAGPASGRQLSGTELGRS